MQLIILQMRGGVSRNETFSLKWRNHILPRVASSNLLERSQPIDWSQRVIFKDESKLRRKLILNSIAFISFLMLP